MRPRPLAIALAALALCAVPAAAQEPVVADGMRLTDPAWTPERAPQEIAVLSGPDELLAGLLRADDPALAAARTALEGGGLVGAFSRTHPAAGGRAPLRIWAARLRDVAGAGAALEGVTAALVPAGSPTGAAQPLARVAGGVLVQRDRGDGTAQAVALFAAGAWLYGIESWGETGTAPSGDEVAGLAVRLWQRQPERGGAADAHPLVVTADLATALGAARSGRTGGDTSATPAPDQERIQAGRLGDTDWALAAFGQNDEPLLFRRPVGGAWVLLGDAGGPGCPRIPARIRTLWGLDTTCPARTSAVADADGGSLAQEANPFHGIGMWVWEVPNSGGTAGIIRRARAHGLRTIFVKSGDGIHYWKQFDAALPALRRAGLRVCGWQYARGRSPVPEARIAARAVQRGADCFVVNAEIEFTRGGIGRNSVMHRRARAYMAELRRRVGARVPIGFTSFAYVDLHARFPYSAFLTGPDAADVNMPQIYWGAFRQPVATAMRRTAQWNAIYGVPLAPIGGTYWKERPADLLRFRCLAAGYGWHGVSYWSLQHTRANQWRSLGTARACVRPAPIPRRYPELKPGTNGDHTSWLQERLRAWGYPVEADGGYGPRTRAAVRTFQRDHGLQGSGSATALTWALLLEPPRRSAPPTA